jgi:hypothetical protein
VGDFGGELSDGGEFLGFVEASADVGLCSYVFDKDSASRYSFCSGFGQWGGGDSQEFCLAVQVISYIVESASLGFAQGRGEAPGPVQSKLAGGVGTFG